MSSEARAASSHSPRRHDRHGRRHGHRPFRLHADPARHDAAARPLGRRCRPHRLGQLSRLSGRRRCWPPAAGPRVTSGCIMLAGLGASALLAARHGPRPTAWRLFLAVRFLAGLASAFVMVFLASIVFSHLANARPQRPAGAAFRRRRPRHRRFLGDDGCCLIAAGTDWRGGWFGAAALVGCRLRGGRLAGRPWTLRRRSAAPRAEAPRQPGAAQGHPRLRPVRPGLHRHRHLPRRHRARGRRRRAVRGRGLAGHRPCRISLGLALEPRRQPHRPVVRLCCSAASSRRSASRPASPRAGWPDRWSAASCSAAPSSPSPRSACRLAQLLAPLSPRRALALMTASFGVGQIVGPIARRLRRRSGRGSFFLPSLGRGRRAARLGRHRLVGATRQNRHDCRPCSAPAAVAGISFRRELWTDAADPADCAAR